MVLSVFGSPVVEHCLRSPPGCELEATVAARRSNQTDGSPMSCPFGPPAAGRAKPPRGAPFRPLGPLRHHGGWPETVPPPPWTAREVPGLALGTSMTETSARKTGTGPPRTGTKYPRLMTRHPRPATREPRPGTGAPRLGTGPPPDLTREQRPTVRRPDETVGKGPATAGTRQMIAQPHRRTASCRRGNGRPVPSMS